MGACAKCAVGIVTFLLLLSAIVVIQPPVKGGEPMAGTAVLRVGEQDRMKTRNPLPALAGDVWTRDILDRVYDTLGKVAPETETLLPYIVKGIDANQDGVFQANEYGVFSKNPGTNPLDVIAYYDFNGVYFHDRVQADEGDLFFSYQLQSLNPRMTLALRALMDKAGRSGSNFTTTRWLFMLPVAKVWENEPVAGNSSLRFAVRYLLQEPFALFSRQTLVDITLYPRHLWEGVGWRWDTTSPGCSEANPCTVTPLHEDFGLAIYPETDSRFGRGIPTMETMYKPYAYLISATPREDSAEEWQLTDDEVIASGPFEFESFNDVQAVAHVTTFRYYYTGNDSKNGVVIDSSISSYVNVPHIDGIVFSVYANIILGILALRTGLIDFYHAPIAPEFLADLQTDPNITLWMSPERGFAYLAYNLRRPAIGKWHYGQADQFDVGLHFRKAVAHLIDKSTIVSSFLQGYGMPGVVPLSPLNVRFYNASLVGYDFSVQSALDEMALAHADALWLSTQLGGPAEAATWYTKDPVTGFYIMPGIGTSEFRLWCPNADYDPVRAISCTTIATEMKNIGINVRAMPSAPSAITQLVNAHDFDMYILSWEIHTSDPDYLYSFFHSSAAAAGLNYPGANIPILDWALDESRKELNESRRIQLLQWVQGILLDNLPYDTLYFRTRIEAARSDRFIGWIPDVGTIWNYWSLLNLTPMTANTPPIADFTVNPSSGDTSTLFAFDASISTDMEDSSSLLQVRWDWEDDGTWDTSWSTVKTAQHRYGALGTYTPRLIVKDSTNLTDTTTRQVQVSNTPPVASFEVLPLAGSIVTTFSVDASGVTDAEDPPTALEVRWDWEDDGTWDSAWTATKTAGHTYAVPANYTIRLEVRDSEGLTGTATHQVEVSNTPPTAAFTVSNAGGDASTVWILNASSSYDLEDPASLLEVRWDWDGDGTWDTSWYSEKVFQHDFPGPGNHTVRMQVRDSGGLTNITTGYVLVEQPDATPSSELVVLLLIIGVVVALGIVITLIYVRKRRAKEDQEPPKGQSP